MQGGYNGIGRGALRALIAVLAVMAAVPAMAATQAYVVPSFDSVRIDAPIRVELTTGRGVAASGEGPRATLDRIALSVSGRLLSIRMTPLRPGEKNAGSATLRLSTGDLRRLVMVGGGAVSVDRMKGLNGDIVVGGNGDVTVAAVEVDRLTVSLAGGGRVTLSGKAGAADIRLWGPGELAASGLAARTARVSNDGPGDMALTAITSADVRASGTGDVTVSGPAACTVANNGAGRVACGGESY